MSETETITTNSRVLGADPLAESGIGEEDMLTLVLPYVKTAREGSCVSGRFWKSMELMESNGIAISDVNEIWWLETVGGHHWMARRVPDDAYVTNPNQLGSDYFEFGNPDEFLCDPDLERFVTEHHLILDQEGKVLIHAMPLVAKKTRIATTIHRGLGPSSVSSILKSSRIHGALRFLGVKTLSQGDD